MAEMWYYTTEGKQMDAVPIKELKRLIGDGTLKPTDMVWKDGMARWIRASSVRELFPDPMSALDQYFTSTTEAESREAQAKASSVTVGSQGATATPLPAASSNGTMPPAPDDASPRKRRPGANEGVRPVRRPRDTGGGSSMMIIMALFFGGFLLLGALGVGVVILVFVIPSQPVIAEKDKINNGPDAIAAPVKDVRDPGPKLEPLPLGVDEGIGVKTSAQAIMRNSFFVRKFRVRAGHQVSFNVTIPGAGPATRFELNVVRDKDHNVELARDPQPPSKNPSVNWVAATTEIVLVRVQNVGPTTNKVSIVYNVSP